MHTIDTLIAKLQELRAITGGDASVKVETSSNQSEIVVVRLEEHNGQEVVFLVGD